MAEEQWVREGPKVPLPEPTQALGEFLLQKVRGHGDKTVMIDGPSGETVSGAQLLARSVAVAEELRRRGVGPGDVVSAALDNTLEVAYVLLGTLYTGAVYAPINPDLHEGDMRHLLGLLEPRVVVCAERAKAAVRGALPPGPGSGSGAEAVAVGSAEWEAFVRPPPDSALAAFEAHHGADVHSPAVIMCSSGTTGPPKGVMLSHRCWYLLLYCIALMVRRNPPEVVAKDRAMQVTPNFWMSGFLANVVNASSGTPLVVCPKFSVEAVLGGVERHRVTSLTLSPPQVAAVAKHPAGLVEQFDCSSLRLFSFGGAALSPALHALAERRVGKRLTQYYGQTECLLAVLPGPRSALKPSSVGTPALNAAIKIVDVESGKTLGPNAEGEICVRSSLVFSGYYKDPEATARTLDADGWLHTGDVGFFDDDGDLFVTDRYKELVKYKGIHIAPAEVESALMAHEAVQDAAVVGIEHDEDQEHPVGFVVKLPGHDVTAQELLNMLKEELPEYKQLHGGVHFVEEVPRTASGKIKRRELRQLARALCQPQAQTQDHAQAQAQAQP